ncbi:MAG: aspartyl protease family protein [Dehalococcoidia bacterium]
MIRGHFKRRGSAPPAPYVTVPVRIAGSHPWTAVDFLVDTGADLTVIHPQDAARVVPNYATRDFDEDPSRRAVGGIGGTSTFVTMTFDLLLVDDEHGAIAATLPLLVAGPRGDVLRNAPSLLGRDILSEFALYVDARTGTVTLTR